MKRKYGLCILGLLLLSGCALFKRKDRLSISQRHETKLEQGLRERQKTLGLSFLKQGTGRLEQKQYSISIEPLGEVQVDETGFSGRAKKVTLKGYGSIRETVEKVVLSVSEERAEKKAKTSATRSARQSHKSKKKEAFVPGWGLLGALALIVLGLLYRKWRRGKGKR